MSLIGKKPLRLELLFGSPKKWDTRKLAFQFDTCLLLSNVIHLKSLPQQHKYDAELLLQLENIKEVVWSKHYFKLRLQTRDNWTGDYPTVLAPFGSCPKKMIFRFVGNATMRSAFIKELEIHGVAIQLLD